MTKACSKSNEPPMWGEYSSAGEFYRSEEWLSIVRDSLAAHQVCLETARRVQDAEAIKFYTTQIRACRQALSLPVKDVTPAQQSLFTSLLPK